MTVQFVLLLCSHPFDYDLRPDTDKLKVHWKPTIKTIVVLLSWRNFRIGTPATCI